RVSCTVQETASPASASTIVAAGNAVTLATDNLPGYTLWVRGGNHGGDAILQLGGNLSNRSTILLQSADQGYRSDIATGPHTLTKLGRASSRARAGGEGVVAGSQKKQATVAGRTY